MSVDVMYQPYVPYLPYQRPAQSTMEQIKKYCPQTTGGSTTSSSAASGGLLSRGLGAGAPDPLDVASYSSSSLAASSLGGGASALAGGSSLSGGAGAGASVASSSALASPSSTLGSAGSSSATPGAGHTGSSHSLLPSDDVTLPRPSSLSSGLVLKQEILTDNAASTNANHHHTTTPPPTTHHHNHPHHQQNQHQQQHQHHQHSHHHHTNTSSSGIHNSSSTHLGGYKDSSSVYKDSSNVYKDSSLYKDSSSVYKDSNLYKDSSSVYKDSSSVYKDSSSVYKDSSSLLDRCSDSPQPTTTHYITANCVLLTYYRGDVATNVDEHFSRALSQPSSFSADNQGTKPTPTWRDLAPSMSQRNFPASFWNSSYYANSSNSLGGAGGLGSGTGGTHHDFASFADPYSSLHSLQTDPWARYGSLAAAASQSTHPYGHHHHHHTAAAATMHDLAYSSTMAAVSNAGRFNSHYGSLFPGARLSAAAAGCAADLGKHSAAGDAWGSRYGDTLTAAAAASHHDATAHGLHTAGLAGGIDTGLAEPTKDLYWF